MVAGGVELERIRTRGRVGGAAGVNLSVREPVAVFALPVCVAKERSLDFVPFYELIHRHRRGFKKRFSNKWSFDKQQGATPDLLPRQVSQFRSWKRKRLVLKRDAVACIVADAPHRYVVGSTILTTACEIVKSSGSASIFCPPNGKKIKRLHGENCAESFGI